MDGLLLPTGVVATVVLCGTFWWLVGTLRGHQPSPKLWSACFSTSLVLCVLFTAAEAASYFGQTTPPDQRQLPNPGGPSATVEQTIFVVAMLVLVIPGTYLGLAVLSLLPPLSWSNKQKLRARVCGGCLAVTLAALTIWMLIEVEQERRRRFFQRHRRPAPKAAVLHVPGWQQSNATTKALLSTLYRTEEVCTMI